MTSKAYDEDSNIRPNYFGIGLLFSVMLLGFLLIPREGLSDAEIQSAPSSGATKVEDSHQTPRCTYTKEYITALEYLRSHDELAVPEADAQKVAFKVSRGCSGAAKRFVRVVSLLNRSGLSGNNSIALGLEFTERSDAEAQAFVAVFLRTFLEESLNLDLAASVKIARSLSLEYEGDIASIQADFEKLVEFCLEESELNFSRPRCATFALETAKNGEKLTGGIAKPFIRLFHYLCSPDGPNLTTTQGLQMAEQIIRGGTDAVDNFIRAFNFGISRKGLGINTQEALRFAKQMSVPEILERH